MQYNVENLFDTVHDEGKRDEEFTPDGRAGWTPQRLKEKMSNLGTIVKGIKNPDGQICPDVLALSEIENANVLKLFKNGPLKECKYTQAVVDPKDPDPRGIRTALLTRLKLAAKPFHHETYFGGRFILEIPLEINGHPLIVFTNHWKSRLSRLPEKDDGSDKRKLASQILRRRVLQIVTENPEADIIALGDLNDEPEDESLKTLGITANPQDLIDGEKGKLFWESSYDLLNHPAFLEIADENKSEAFKRARFTYYYDREKKYLQFDHILLSKGLFDDEGFRYRPNSFQIVKMKNFVNLRTGAPLPYKPSTDETEATGAADHFPVLVRLDIDDE